MRNINMFADKASLILRKMLASPDEKCVVRDFTDGEGVSIGLAQEVLEALEKKGYAERVKTGPNSYTLLTNPDKLIEAWVLKYQFEFNQVYSYYSSEKNPLNDIKEYFQGENYALTLHSGANLITSY
ncbi:MAG: hypothetical protein KKH83_03340, partial [Candidatus Margulisbacteria bacterium]|nr:hypothetical protein [Candidatus Margulisiibacteriota bacterium]